MVKLVTAKPTVPILVSFVAPVVSVALKAILLLSVPIASPSPAASVKEVGLIVAR